MMIVFYHGRAPRNIYRARSIYVPWRALNFIGVTKSILDFSSCATKMICGEVLLGFNRLEISCSGIEV